MSRLIKEYNGVSRKELKYLILSRCKVHTSWYVYKTYDDLKKADKDYKHYIHLCSESNWKLVEVEL